MRVFVTGATGFIGAHLCRRLVSEGHHVIALVRDPAKAARELPEGVETFAGDLGVFERPDLVLPSCEVVIHLAGVVTARDEAEYDAINFGAVKSLVAAFARQRVRPRRLLFASSLAAAGPSPRGGVHTEGDEPHPVEPYGRAKLKAERFLAEEAPFPTTSFRPSLVFGPRDTATLTFFKLAKRGIGFRVAGAPQALSFIAVDDAVAGIVAMMEDASAEHRVYFLTAEEPLDSERLWRAMEAALARRVRVLRVPRAVLVVASWFSTLGSRLFGTRNQLDAKQVAQMTAPGFVCSGAALTRAHGWRAQVTLEESLRRAWRAYREDGWV